MISSIEYVSINKNISNNIVCIGLKYPILKKLFENCFIVEIVISIFLPIFLQNVLICSFAFLFIFFNFINFKYVSINYFFNLEHK